MSVKTSKGLFAAVLSKLDEDKKLEESNSENLNRGEQSSTNTKTANFAQNGQAENKPAQNGLGSEKSELRSNSPHLLKVAAGVKQMQERSKLAEDLLRSGSQIVEIDPDKIHPSKIKDRLDSAYDEAEIAEITASMRERGQIVPGLVRIIDGKSDEFEIVYGRRRLLAAKRLGIAFKAAIRDLSDEEAIIFQGEENTARNDLSFIEKCLFAKAQEEAGFKRETICASLSTGKSHISEMIKLGKAITPALLDALGKAEMIGRGRWLLLARNLADFSDSEQTRIVQEIKEKTSFGALNSEEKFGLFLDAFDQQGDKKAVKQAKKLAKAKNNDLSSGLKWQSSDQHFSLVFNKEKAVLSLNNSAAKSANNPNEQNPNRQNRASALQNSEHQTVEAHALGGFVDFLASELDALYSAYQLACQNQSKSGDS